MMSISVENVSKKFHHRAALFGLLGAERAGVTHALRNVSLEVGPGEVLAIMGPNGSGKTTLLKLIATILEPDEGSIRVMGFETRTQSVAVRRQVGFAVGFDRSFFPRLTARENLDFFATFDDVDRRVRAAAIERSIDTCNIAEFADVLAMKLSSGQYQRLAIARALLKQPRILLLDEPTRSLDPVATEQLWSVAQNARDAGMAVVLATHSFEEAAALADRALVLNGGEVAETCALHGSTNALRAIYFSHHARGAHEVLAAAGASR
jgi:ABC-2 type transport system ATP-binding protein